LSFFNKAHSNFEVAIKMIGNIEENIKNIMIHNGRKASLNKCDVCARSGSAVKSGIKKIFLLMDI
jgi:hypothetical protein